MSKPTLSFGKQLHRNLEPLATVATPATALQGWAFACCRPIKKVATGGNTNPFLNISRQHLPLLGASLLPVKNQRQQNLAGDYAGKLFIPRLLPVLPLLPVFLKPDEHVYECLAGGCAQ